MNLSVLPHLYPPKQMKKVKNKNFKPSIGLAKDNLLKINKNTLYKTNYRHSINI